MTANPLDEIAEAQAEKPVEAEPWRKLPRYQWPREARRRGR